MRETWKGIWRRLGVAADQKAPVSAREVRAMIEGLAHAVAVIVKRSAVNAERLSGHSLRAGFVTEAKRNGADDAAIMDQTGHKSLAMVHRYHRRTKQWEKPASARLGL